MSQKGINLTVKILTDMQQARLELIRMGCERNFGTKSGKQDILLGQLFARAENEIKEDFAKYVAMEIYKDKKKCKK